MKGIMRKGMILMLATAAALSITGCDNNKGPAMSEYQRINKEIASNMYIFYLWNEGYPEAMNIPDTYPADFFEGLLVEQDKWSQITDDAVSFFGSVNNDGTSFGYGLNFYYFSDTRELWAQVMYVHAGTPAEGAELKRGDMISAIGGVKLTQDRSTADYRNLIYASSLDITVHDNIDAPGRRVQLTASKKYLDPVVLTDVFEVNGMKIGYLCYTDYVQGSHDRLREVFSDFQSQDVTELILDLRYNGGGSTATSQFLASLLAPASALDGSTVYVKDQWNKYWTQREKPETFITYFLESDKVPQNIDLSRLYVLTTEDTASASEQTIVGLMPYMTVKTVGTATHGKFVGGLPLPYKIENGVAVADLSTDMKTWAMYIMTFRYTNKNGYPTDNIKLPANIVVEENFRTLKPLGDPTDPFIAAAIADITGQPQPSPAFISPAERPTVIRSIGSGVPTGILIKDDGGAWLEALNETY